MTETESGAARSRYSTVAIILHWTIAALIILQVVLAKRMEAKTPEAFAIIQLHKSIGITVLLLSLGRLGWRLANPPPPEPELARWERLLSIAVHWAFYGVMILMPITGWIMVSASRYNLPTLLYGTIPWPHLPGLPELAPAAKAAWHDWAETAHSVIIKGAFVLFLLHVAGALKHQLFSRTEPVLSRMAPGARSGRWLEPRLFAILAGFVAVIAFGVVYKPPHRPMGVAPPPVAAVEPDVAPAEPAAPATAATATAEPEAPAAPEPAVKWTVSPGSTLGFGTSWSGEAIPGRFDRWTADIVFSPDDLEHSRVSVSIDLASVNTGDPQRDSSIPMTDWFDVATHPKATFTAKRFSKTGEGRFIAHGQLSLKGVTRPLDLPFRLKIDGDRADMRGVTSLDRTVFGVGQGEWASTDQIPAKVSVTVSLKARRTSP